MNRQELEQYEPKIDAALKASLKAMAATTELQSAPEHLEESLLTAFRKQHSTKPLPIQQPVKESRWRLFPVWTYAAAAAALLVAGYVISVWRSATPAPAGSVPKYVLATANSVQSSLEGNLRPALIAQSQNLPARPAAIRKHLPPIDDGSSVQSSLGEFTLLSSEEIATDFLPLTYETDSQPMESGQVIRVQVPRTTLASFGLPVNLERAHEPVKADLLLAEDGSARAIRFIR